MHMKNSKNLMNNLKQLKKKRTEIQKEIDFLNKLRELT
jgi:hypothetical protein